MCTVVAGVVARYTVYEDDLFLAVLDLEPAERGHVLLITKAHAHYLDELPPDVGRSMLAVANLLREAIRAAPIPSTTVLMFLSDGEPDYKPIPHVHMHVFPRNPLKPAEGLGDNSGGTLGETATQIATAISQLQAHEVRPDSPGHRSLFWRGDSDADASIAQHR